MEGKFGKLLLDNVYEYIHKQMTKDVINEYNEWFYYDDKINCLKKRQDEKDFQDLMNYDFSDPKCVYEGNDKEFNWRSQDNTTFYYGVGYPIYNNYYAVGTLPKNY